MELIVNDVVEHNGLKQYLVISPIDVLNNFQLLFGDKGLNGLKNAIILTGGKSFYDIKRYFQFVGIIKYSEINETFTMNIFESDSIDNFLDGYLKLKGENWKQSDLDKIGDITNEIINDKNKELATIVLKKLF